MGALLAWLRWDSPALVALAAAGVLLWALRPMGGRWLASGLTLVVVSGVVGAFAGERELRSVTENWDEVWEDRQTQIQSRLSDEMDALVAEGGAAVDGLAQAVAEGEGHLPEDDELARIREAGGLDALAVYGPDARVLGWDGVHHGVVPGGVRRGESRYSYEERALFGYLYISTPLPDHQGVAVGAVRLRAELPPHLDKPPTNFASRFEDMVGAEIRVSRADVVEGESVWDLRLEERTLLNVSLLRPDQAQVRDDVRRTWGRGVLVAVVLGWLLLALGTRRMPGARFGSGSVLLFGAAVTPVGFLLGLPGLASPAEFLLPDPLTVPLGTVLAVGAAGIVVLGMAGVRKKGGAWRRLLPPLAALLAFPGAVLLIRAGAGMDLVAGPTPTWAAYLGAFAVVLTLVAGLALRAVPSTGGEGAVARLAVGGALCVGLMAAFGHVARESPPLDAAFVALWALPAWVLAGAVAGWSGGRVPLVVWGAAVVLGVTASVPLAWSDRISGQMAAAEDRVEGLGAQVDPYLEFLLHRLGDEIRILDARGREPVEVLYGAWVASGMAAEGYPLWLTLWSPYDEPEEELRIGPGDVRPAVDPALRHQAREEARTILQRTGRGEAHYVSASPLGGGRVVTAAVPPRRSLGPEGLLGGFLAEDPAPRESLVLIPTGPGGLGPEEPGVEWTRVDEGWQAEFDVAYPYQTYHGHYLIPLSGYTVLLARAALLGLLLTAVFGALWGLGRLTGTVPRDDWRRILELLPAFRTRVTVALFLFFLAPTLAFGTLAYQALAGGTVRAAEAQAERFADEAATRYAEWDGVMPRVLALQSGGDILLYRHGELAGGSSPELVELGLFPGWLPPSLHQAMAEGEELTVTREWEVGGREHVVAYRWLAQGDVLAAPVEVEPRALGFHERELAHLLAFAVVLGAGLSVLLAVVAGRALSRPIQTLQVASERVGAGNLGVRLPEDRGDEFGAVFQAFNRMVERLRGARWELLATNRRTKAVVEEVATGVVALDGEGRVTLQNRRAEALLSSELLVGEPLPREGDAGNARDVAAWLETAFEGAQEAGREFQFGERRVRVRARRIARRGSAGGVVLSLEDVTDELRTERILAWGEMARQVAHEVKNPLTPIKLGVQHIERAWEDGRSDFRQILQRNVTAILDEIERLAAVAASFSRFGAPGAAGEAPLEPVQVEAVARDVLALYSAGESAVRFTLHLEDEVLPAVSARESELKEVLVNLLENAREAMLSEGTVTIGVRHGDGVVDVTVQDEGTGMPQEVQARMFEPHFSTRSSGTGLGLAIVQRLVQSWGGSVDVESRTGEGTCVRLTLRPWDGEAPTRESPEREGSAEETVASEAVHGGEGGGTEDDVGPPT